MKIDATAEDVGPLTPAAARAEFDADLTYLDTAAVGLPPRRSWMALQQALAQWRGGTAAAAAYDVAVGAPQGRRAAWGVSVPVTRPPRPRCTRCPLRYRPPAAPRRR